MWDDNNPLMVLNCMQTMVSWNKKQTYLISQEKYQKYKELVEMEIERYMIRILMVENFGNHD